MKEKEKEISFIEGEYNTLIEYLTDKYNAVSGQMFGKKCIKVSNKAAVALFKEYIIFKLPKEDVSEALELEGSALWDPSGKGRAMKEWIQLPIEHKSRFKELSVKATRYVVSL